MADGGSLSLSPASLRKLAGPEGGNTRNSVAYLAHANLTGALYLISNFSTGCVSHE